MADSCTKFTTHLASQTPVFDAMFLKDWKPLDSPIMGRHQTSVWEQGSGDTHYQDKIEIGQPDMTVPWQRMQAGACEGNPCTAPRTFVNYGTTRNSSYMEQRDLTSQLFCLDQIRMSTKPSEQFRQIYEGIKKIPALYTSDFLRVHAFDRNSTVQICQSDFPTFTPDITPDDGSAPNISGMLTTIDLGATANLPTSELTWSYLDYLSTSLALRGYYQAGSGLPNGLYNLITDQINTAN